VNSLGDTEKITGELGSFLHFLLRVDIVFSVVFSIVTNGFEGLQTGSGGSVCIDIDSVSTLDVLEKSHGSVPSVILHHIGVALTLASVMSGVLEDASLSVSALGGMLQKVLAN